jgi:integrase
MAGKQAKILADLDAERLLTLARKTRYPLRDRCLVLFSIKAGMRAGEIAKVTWEMVLEPTGKVGSSIELLDDAAKMGSGRRIPIHADLKLALERLKRISTMRGSIIRSERGAGMRPSSVVNWFAKAYSKLGFVGCSSHSGRRTFITRAARMVHRAGGSLRDVQALAGHRSIEVTQRYIDGDTDAQRKLVSLI